MKAFSPDRVEPACSEIRPEESILDTKELFSRGVAEIITEAELKEKLDRGRPLRLKQGFDPSRPDLHIGHAMGLRKLRTFQEMGHQVVLIVGDWTAQIGDPSGRDESRTMLTAAEVKENAETYMRQFFSIIDRERTEVRWQTEWFGEFSLEDVFKLSSRFTLAQMMTHNTFRSRWEQGNPLTLMEMMYPMLQAYDSVVIEADVEFGGTDQKFNILCGRDLQEQMGQEPQNVFLVPLLPGTDGRKMSKSFGNTIDLYMDPDEIFGKVMSITDEMIPDYFEYATDIELSRAVEIRELLAGGGVNPMELKKELGVEVVRMLQGAEAASAARDRFERQFSKRILPADIPVKKLDAPMNIVDLLVSEGFAGSKTKARKLIEQNAVSYLAGDAVSIKDRTGIADPGFLVEPGSGIVIKSGKRNYLRIG